MSALEPTKLPKSEKLRGATIFDDETNEEIGPTCFREHLDEAFDCLVVTFKYDAHVASLIYDAIHNAVHQGNFSEEDYMQLQIRFKSVYINGNSSSVARWFDDFSPFALSVSVCVSQLISRS